MKYSLRNSRSIFKQKYKYKMFLLFSLPSWLVKYFRLYELLATPLYLGSFLPPIGSKIKDNKIS